MHNSLVNNLVDENVGKNTKTVTSLLLKTVLHPPLPTTTQLDGNHIQLETMQIGALERGMQIGASMHIGALREASTGIKDRL